MANTVTHTMQRVGTMPPRIRMTLTINADQHPALAGWVWNHAFSGPAVLREVLDRAVRDGSINQVEASMQNGEPDGQ